MIFRVDGFVPYCILGLLGERKEMISSELGGFSDAYCVCVCVLCVIRYYA